jgi:anaphase-promoting complex subunit 3
MNQFDPKIVSQRLISLVHRCLDADLYKTALFYAERLFAMDGTNHDSRHLLSNVLLKMEQPHSALHLVTRPQDEPCSGCYLTSARCNEALLRPQKAREMTLKALEILQNSDSNQLGTYSYHRNR